MKRDDPFALNERGDITTYRICPRFIAPRGEGEPIPFAYSCPHCWLPERNALWGSDESSPRNVRQNDRTCSLSAPWSHRIRHFPAETRLKPGYSEDTLVHVRVLCPLLFLPFLNAECGSEGLLRGSHKLPRCPKCKSCCIRDAFVRALLCYIVAGGAPSHPRAPLHSVACCFLIPSPSPPSLDPIAFKG